MKQFIHSKLARIATKFVGICRLVSGKVTGLFESNVYFGRKPAGLPPGSIVLFPYQENILCCGIAAIVSYKGKKKAASFPKPAQLDEMAAAIQGQGFDHLQKSRIQ